MLLARFFCTAFAGQLRLPQTLKAIQSLKPTYIGSIVYSRAYKPAFFAAAQEDGGLAATFTEAFARIEYINPDPKDRTDVSDESLASIEEKLGYTFKNRDLLRLALTHSSASSASHNAMLAWLGDSTMNLVLTEMLIIACGKDVNMGQASDLRILLVSRLHCEKIGRRLNIHESMVIGKSQYKFGPGPQMIAEAFEAILGAVYVDGGGVDAVRKVYRTCVPLPAKMEDLMALLVDEDGGIGRNSKKDVESDHQVIVEEEVMPQYGA